MSLGSFLSGVVLLTDSGDFLPGLIPSSFGTRLGAADLSYLGLFALGCAGGITSLEGVGVVNTGSGPLL